MPCRYGDSIGDVSSYMLRAKTGLLIGVVDNDKKIPSYIQTFQTQKQSNGLILKKHPDNDHYVIMVSPDSERWLETQLGECEKSLADFKFRDMKHFKEETKRKDEHPQVQRMLNTLEQNKVPGFVTLGTWIEEILQGKTSKGKGKYNRNSRRRK